MHEVGMQSELCDPFAVGMLIHDDNGWTAMSVNESGNRCQQWILNQALPSSSDVGLVEQRLQESPHTTPCRASVGTSTEEGTEDRSQGVIGKTAGHRRQQR